MYFYPDAAAHAYDAAGLRAVIGLPVLDFPTPYASDADAYLRLGLDARDRFRHLPRLGWMLAPHAPYTVGDAAFAKIVTYARQLDLASQTHLQETRAELDEAMAKYGESELARLDRLGATGPGFLAIHAVHLGPGDRELLVRHGCSVAHCPASNMKLASGVAPVVDLLSRGVNVALGTDGAHRTTASTCSPRCASPRCSRRSPAAMLPRCRRHRSCAWRRWAVRRRSPWATRSAAWSPASRRTSSRWTNGTGRICRWKRQVTC